MKKTIFFLSILFVVFSFAPSLYEIYQAKNVPPSRVFVLEHNYMFDYNFYLSRIRQGQEGKWLVVEKYYNRPHQSSLFQIFYLFLGKLGRLGGLEPPIIYHISRLLLGFILLVMIGRYIYFSFSILFSLPPNDRQERKKWWVLITYLLVVTAGSWPIPTQLKGGGWRFATYMGWWSAIDSLQRITFIPHILLGQIGLLLFVWRFGGSFEKNRLPIWFRLLIWGMVGLAIGIIFPPTLVVVYAVFVVLSLFELRLHLGQGVTLEKWLCSKILPRLIFILLSFPALVYLQLMFRIMPWKALALFDIEHRMPLPYKEYALSLGPVLPLGILGGMVILGRLGRLRRKERRLLPVVSWFLAVGLLFVIFEHVPQQSPLRFTEAAIHIPLGILAGYFFYSLWQKIREIRVIREIRGVKLIRGAVAMIIGGVVVMGLLVMGSMAGWLADQATAKRLGSWIVPTGAQIIYPLRDFMDGVYFLRNNTQKEDVVLAYVTAGNFIPAYAGNFVYLGHANTPNEDGREKIAVRFFSGKMKKEEAKEFLGKERISYIYFGPQEKELGGVEGLEEIYPFVRIVYENERVKVYRVVLKS